MSRPAIRDPHAVPIVAIDDALPPIDPGLLTAGALRERFAEARGWTPEFTGDGASSGREPAFASVLMPLVDRPEGLSVLLTQRTAHLRDHAGQVSFPGGRAEPTDADEIDTALREAEEEVGLARRHVQVMGTLHPYSTVTNFVVTPVVGLVRPGFELTLDPFEVAAAFEVPLAFLMTPANHRRHRFEHEGQERHFLSMLWEGPGADGRQQTFFIWGATASMLRNLYRFLAA